MQLTMLWLYLTGWRNCRLNTPHATAGDDASNTCNTYPLLKEQTR